MEQEKKKPRGFAKLSPEERKANASRAGKAAHAAGKAHKFSSEQARIAGAIGGRAPKKKGGVA